jgi:hypothetical protein
MPDSVFVPGCITRVDSEPIAFKQAGALSASLLQNGSPYAIFSTQPTTDLISIRWSNPDQSSWDVWRCFDFVHLPERVAAANLSNFYPEIYVSTGAGRLMVRRFYSDVSGWDNWTELSLPTAASVAQDVAAVGLPSPLMFVYVIDRGRIFVRHRKSTDWQSEYGLWASVSTPTPANRLCAAMRVDGRQQLFVLTGGGAVITAVQSVADPDSSFGAFVSFGDASAPQFSDLQCGYAADSSPEIFALSDGVAWAGQPNAAGGTWTKDAGLVSPSLQTLAVGSQPRAMPTVFGTDATNKLWSRVAGSDAGWTLIDQ